MTYPPRGSCLGGEEGGEKLCPLAPAAPTPSMGAFLEREPKSGLSGHPSAGGHPWGRPAAAPPDCRLFQLHANREAGVLRRQDLAWEKPDTGCGDPKRVWEPLWESLSISLLSPVRRPGRGRPPASIPAALALPHPHSGGGRTCHSRVCHADRGKVEVKGVKGRVGWEQVWGNGSGSGTAGGPVGPARG